MTNHSNFNGQRFFLNDGGTTAAADTNNRLRRDAGTLEDGVLNVGEQVALKQLTLTFTASDGSFESGDVFRISMDGTLDTAAVVPEPSVMMFVSAFGILPLLRRRRK